MKLWFVEPKPNVFVSGVKESVALGVLEYLFQHCPVDAGLVCFRAISTAPGYEIRTWGATSKQMTILSGLQLVIENPSQP
jgi:CRISPR-associated protein Cas2